MEERDQSVELLINDDAANANTIQDHSAEESRRQAEASREEQAKQDRSPHQW